MSLEFFFGLHTRPTFPTQLASSVETIQSRLVLSDISLVDLHGVSLLRLARLVCLGRPARL